MSGTPYKPEGQGAPGPAPDPSMDDILASIRRILNEDDTPKPPSADGPAAPDDVLVLDSSMMVQPEQPPAPPAAASAPPAPPLVPPPQAVAPPAVDEPARGPDGGLIAPAAAAAAASSVGQLMRTLAAERSAAVHRGGPTIEDLVRDEMRPLLKEWLDTHLPPLVERLVRAEIERVVGRST